MVDLLDYLGSHRIRSSKPFVYTGTTQVDTCTTIADLKATHTSIEAVARHKIDWLVCPTIDPRPSLSHGHFIGGGDKIKLIWWVGLTF